MNLTVKADKLRVSWDRDGTWLSFRTDLRNVKDLPAELDKPHVLELKPERKKRSLDSNGYMWTLLDKLAEALGNGTGKDDLYRSYIEKCGVFRDFHLEENEVSTFRAAWGRLGAGWLTEQIDYTPNGERVVIRAYYGSSTYNTKQMSRLIDMVVTDCKMMGIETLPPERLAALIGDWNV